MRVKLGATRTARNSEVLYYFDRSFFFNRPIYDLDDEEDVVIVCKSKEILSAIPVEFFQKKS